VAVSADAGPLSPLGKLWLAAEIVFTYPRVRWLLWRRDLPAVVATLRRFPNPDGESGGESGNDYRRRGRQLGRAASRTLRLLPADSRCLARSLVLLALLARRRIAAQLVIAARQGPDFAAHAWVELEGVPLLDPGPRDYERLVEI
jgi:Transglutaminase-like superfamily